MKELQPGVFRSCCREDRHPNNQINIKSKECNTVSLFIDYRVEGRITHRPCLYMYGYLEGIDMESYSKNQNRRIIEDKEAM